VKFGAPAFDVLGEVLKRHAIERKFDTERGGTLTHSAPMPVVGAAAWDGAPPRPARR